MVRVRIKQLFGGHRLHTTIAEQDIQASVVSIRNLQIRLPARNRIVYHVTDTAMPSATIKMIKLVMIMLLANSRSVGTSQRSGPNFTGSSTFEQFSKSALGLRCRVPSNLINRCDFRSFHSLVSSRRADPALY